MADMVWEQETVGGVQSVTDKVWEQETVGGVRSVADNFPCVCTYFIPICVFYAILNYIHTFHHHCCVNTGHHTLFTDNQLRSNNTTVINTH